MINWSPRKQLIIVVLAQRVELFPWWSHALSVLGLAPRARGWDLSGALAAQADGASGPADAGAGSLEEIGPDIGPHSEAKTDLGRARTSLEEL